MIAWQAFSGIHIGIDNLCVLRSVAKLIDRGIEGTSLPLVKDGDLLANIHSMFGLRGEGTVKVSEVKGPCRSGSGRWGDVRNEDRVGNDGAGMAADLGRFRQKMR